jgi:ribosomal protein S18 acetylase RimI-like enzyme
LTPDGIVDGVRVRSAIPADLPALALLDDEVFPDSDRWSLLRGLIAGTLGFCLVAEDPGSASLVGYVAVAERHFFGRDFIELLQVAESGRRRGTGRLLMQTAAARSATHTVFTSTNESNAPMRGLLSSLGWTVSGTLDGLDEGDPEIVYYLPRETE